MDAHASTAGKPREADAWFESARVGGGVLAFLLAFILLIRLIKSFFVRPVVRLPLAQPEPVSPESSRNTRQAIYNLYGVDTQFNPEHFHHRVTSTSMLVMQAFCDRNPQHIRAFISDGIHERIILQGAECKGAPRRVRLDQMVLSECRICEAAFQGSFEHASVLLRGTLAVTPLDPETDKSAATKPEARQFAEVWTFLRRRNAARGVKKGLMEGFCPNCGVSLAMNQHSKCQQCGALIRSGMFDWVLAEITQECAWERAPLFEVSGAEILQQRDPLLNVALLEDRASVIFWRYLAALRMGRKDPLRKSATEACCERLEKPLKSGQYFRNPSVDSIRTRGFLPGKANDRALVEVRWNAESAQRGDPGDGRAGRSAVSRSLLVLERSKDAKSEIADGFGSSHCPRCGAPETLNPDPGCAYCGAMINDGALSWALSDLIPFNSVEARQMLGMAAEQDKNVNAFAYGRRTIDLPGNFEPRPPPPPKICRVELIAWAILAARADGEVDPAERNMILAMALRMGLTVDRVELLWRADPLEAAAPRSLPEAKDWLEVLARLSLVDGKLSEKESEPLVRMARHAGMPEAEARMTLSHIRSRLYEQMPIDLHAQWKKASS